MIIHMQFFLICSFIFINYRVTGLIRTGALTQEEKPIWYDVMAAFPPKVPPVYHQCPQDVQVADIIYKEDLIRA